MKIRTNIVSICVIFFAVLLFSKAQTPSEFDTSQFIDSLITDMTLEEKLGQLNQQRWAWKQDAEEKHEMYRQHIRSGKIGSFLGIHGAELTQELQRIAVEESRPGIPLLFAQDVVILVFGEGPLMTGEANNRADISLPGDQLLLAQKLIGIHKQVIIVLMNGRPLAIPWIAENAPAILECWFLGTEMGTAVADILFGNFNPSGKLTTTFPSATGQIPIYYNHKNTDRPPLENDHYTSKYLAVPWTTLYLFGFGLSYTTFKYSNMKITTYEIQPEDSITVSVDVENTGSCYGQEVVQLYVRDEVASITPAVKKLRGFTKIGLKPDQKKTVYFTIGEEDLSFYSQDLKRIVEPGSFTVFVGGSSCDVLSAEFTVTDGSE